jgi:hypothetical protein
VVIAAVFAVLIIQTYGGEVHVTEGLSDHACAEAKCVAEWGMTCADAEAQAKATWETMKREDAAYVAAHPKEVAACKAREAKGHYHMVLPSCEMSPTVSSAVTFGSMFPSGVRTAQCAK